MHLLTRLFPPGLLLTGQNLYEEAGRQGPKRLGIYLGGVSCAFRREIGVRVGFEMWTRVLCWDRKWLYVVTHFLPRGAVRPKGFAFQPWKKNVARRTKEDATPVAAVEKKEEGKEGKGRGNPLFFATAVAKYVCKRGRLTIPPELVLRNSGLLPPKPQNPPTNPPEPTTGPPPSTDSPSLAPTGEKDATASLPPIANLAASTPAPGGEGGKTGEEEEWSYERIEAERARGMAIMEAWNRTELLDEAFGGSEAVALGEFWDFP